MENKTSPFGADTEKYWKNRYEYFSRFDEGIEIDKEGLYSVTPESIALQIAKRIKAVKIFDGFCGVGGNAIAFARAGMNVVTADTNAERLRMAQHNASIYGVETLISFIHDDVFALLAATDADAVFFDPPWGGPDYYTKKEFLLSDFLPDGNTLIEAAFNRTSNVSLKIPRNFATAALEKANRTYAIEPALLNGRHLFSVAYFQ